MNQQPRKKI